MMRWVFAEYEAVNVRLVSIEKQVWKVCIETLRRALVIERRREHVILR